MKKLPSLLAAVLIFAALVIYPSQALTAAANGISLCGRLIIPTLFPFFVATVLLSELGFAAYLGRLLSPVASRLFGVSGVGASAFIVGLCGGYPLGAAYIADMRRAGRLDCREASALLPFCNNSGPAFIIGGVGVGVFSSSAAGLLLYAVHIFSAVIGGILLSDRAYASSESHISLSSADFGIALTSSVKKSVLSVLYVCGFVVSFSVFIDLLCAFGPFDALSAGVSSLLGVDIQWGRAFFTGVFEIGTAVGAMQGLALSPENLALAAFILGWGGVSVHFQTFAMLDGTDIKTARYVIGRFLIAAIAAITAFAAGIILY